AAHDLVVAPAVPVEGVALASPFDEHRPLVLRDAGLGEEPPRPHQRGGERGVESGGTGEVGAGAGRRGHEVPPRWSKVDRVVMWARQRVSSTKGSRESSASVSPKVSSVPRISPRWMPHTTSGWSWARERKGQSTRSIRTVRPESS